MALQVALSDLRDAPDATYTVGGQRQYVRHIQCVVSDDGVVPIVDPVAVGPNELIGLVQAADSSLIPGAAYTVTIRGRVDSDSVSTLRLLVPLRDESDPTRWEITAQYNSLSESNNTYNDAGDQDLGQWDTERPLVAWNQIFFTEHAQFGKLFSKGTKVGDRPACPPVFSGPFDQLTNDAAITNSAGGIIGDPPPERDMERQGLVIERNMDQIDWDQIAALSNSVNAALFPIAWLGQSFDIKQWQGKLKSITPREHYRGGRYVWRVRYEFDIWSRTWIQDFLDKGWQVIDFSNLGNPAFDGTDSVVAKTLEGLPVTIPALLNTDGSAQKATTVGTSGQERYKIEDACYRSYLLYDVEDWTNFSSNWMMKNLPNNYDRTNDPNP